MGDAWTAADADFMAGCWDEDDGDASEGLPPLAPSLPSGARAFSRTAIARGVRPEVPASAGGAAATLLLPLP